MNAVCRAENSEKVFSFRRLAPYQVYVAVEAEQVDPASWLEGAIQLGVGTPHRRYLNITHEPTTCGSIVCVAGPRELELNFILLLDGPDIICSWR